MFPLDSFKLKQECSPVSATTTRKRETNGFILQEFKRALHSVRIIYGGGGGLKPTQSSKPGAGIVEPWRQHVLDSSSDATLEPSTYLTAVFLWKLQKQAHFFVQHFKQKQKKLC